MGSKPKSIKKNPIDFHKDFHRAVIENLSDYSVFTIDKNGIIKSWNKRAEMLFGYNKKEVIGKNCSLLFTVEDRQNKVPENELSEAAKKSKTMGERYYLRKDGSLFWASGITFPVEDKKRVHKGFTKIMHDISAEKESSERKDQFISTASHEMKAPITTMKLFADIVKKKTKKINNTSLSDSVGDLDGQIDRLIDLTNYLLDVSKIQGGTLKLEKKYFNLNKLVDTIVLSMKSIRPKHVFILEIDIKDKVYGDCERISQVLTNLISNAAKYSPEGGKIIIKARQDKKSTKISVKDSGLGVTKDDQKKLFTRFFRSEKAKERNINGIGLGLYISRKIISAHDGTLRMKSNVGKGSTFYFDLPKKPLMIK